MRKLILKLCFLTLLVLCVVLYFERHFATVHVMRDEPVLIKSVVIVNNRVPKCGSTLMIYLLTYLSRKSKRFTFLRSTNYFHYRFSSKKQAQLAEHLVNYSRKAKRRRVLYEQHMHFIHLNITSNIRHFYINQIRDPLDYAMSNYEFKRYRCLYHKYSTACKQMHRSIRDLTMDDCVATGDPERCLTRSYGIGSMISFFCGQAPLCDDTKQRPNSSAALALAKANIERFYAFVGLLEYVESSLELLEHVYPPLFTGITDIYRNRIKGRRMKVTPDKHRAGISNETRAVLLQLLKPEYELYEFVRQRFVNQYRKIYGRGP